MKKIYFTFSILFSLCSLSFAEQNTTHRIPQFSNDKVSVWQTIIYPDQNQALPMHNHEHDHILVALTDGTLKIVNNKGESHLLKLSQGKAYYLTKDIPGETHMDVNVTNHPIKVMVIDLKS